MAGVLSTGGGRGRRALDADVLVLPMIDLLMVTISFLMLTAALTHSARLTSTAEVPGGDVVTPPRPERVLHVDMRRDDVALEWREGPTVVRASSVGRGADLASALRAEWREAGQHKEVGDRALDRAVLHVGDGSRYAELASALDAFHGVRRPVALRARGPADVVPAFNVALAKD